MKILHIDTEKGFRGGQQQLLYLAQGLNKYAITSIIACRDILLSKAKSLGFETVDIDSYRDYPNLTKVAKNCDILHAHASKAHSLGVFLKILTQKPLIYTRRVDFMQKKITKLKYILTDKVVSVSDAVANILYQRFNVVSEVIYDAVDVNLIHRVDEEKVKMIKKQYGPLIVGNIGALTSQKDHKTLIEAAALLPKHITFLVLGEGPLRNQLEAYVKQNNLEKNFFFVGFKEDIYNYLAAIDCFVVSSEYEGLCSSILQAFLFSKPVIATDAGGVRELIGKNRGLLVPIKNPRALANAILTILKDVILLNEIVRNSRNFVDSFYIDNVSVKYKSLYENIFKAGVFAIALFFNLS